jgi:hypothetical protein
MNNRKILIIGAMLTTFMTTSVHAYSDMNAKGDCLNTIERAGKYHKSSNKHVVNKGHKSYKVTGDIRSRRDNSTHSFTCEIRHGHVVNWHVGGSHRANSSNKDTAVAIGAGILAIAALSALGGDTKGTTHQSKQYNDYNTGGSAFDDMRYLKQQCRQNLRHHIRRAHGRVSKVSLDTAHLHRQSLNGRGFVVFENGGERDLDYNCVFDYRGHIRDGHYQFGRY